MRSIERMSEKEISKASLRRLFKTRNAPSLQKSLQLETWTRTRWVDSLTAAAGASSS